MPLLAVAPLRSRIPTVLIPFAAMPPRRAAIVATVVSDTSPLQGNRNYAG